MRSFVFSLLLVSVCSLPHEDVIERSPSSYAHPLNKRDLETLGPKFQIIADEAQHVNVITGTEEVERVLKEAGLVDQIKLSDLQSSIGQGHDVVNLNFDGSEELNLQRSCLPDSWPFKKGDIHNHNVCQNQHQFSLLGNRVVNIFCGPSNQSESTVSLRTSSPPSTIEVKDLLVDKVSFHTTEEVFQLPVFIKL